MFPYWRLSAYYFFYFGFIGAFSPYFGLYFQSLGFSAAAIAVLMSMMQVMRVLAPNLWGWLAERRDTRMPIVRLSAVVSLAGFCLFFLTTSFAGIFVAMALMAFFWSAALPLIESVTFSHLGTRVQAYGRVRVWGSVGFVVAVLGIGYVLDVAPIGAVLWMNAVVFVGIVLCAFIVPEAPRRDVQADGAGLRDTLRRTEVRALLGMCFCMSAAHGGYYVFFSIHLVGNGYDKAAVGWLWTLGVLAEICVFMGMPWLTRHCSLRTILQWSLAAAVVRFLATGWGVGSVWLMVLAQLLHGLTFGAYHAAAIALVNQWFPGKLQARGQALYGSLSFGAGGLFGGMASGLIWDDLGAGWAYALGAAFALAGLVWLTAGWRDMERVKGGGA